MLVFVLFTLTIVVDSVSFSWDLGPCSFCVSLSLALVTIFVKQSRGQVSRNIARSDVVSFYW